MRHVNRKFLPDINTISRHPVPVFQIGQTHVKPLGNLPDHIPALHRVNQFGFIAGNSVGMGVFLKTAFRIGRTVTIIKIRLPVISKNRILFIDKLSYIIIRNPQGITLSKTGRYDIRTILRIQIPDLFHGYIHQLRHLLEMQGIGNHDRVAHCG